ncbi:MAG TPA: hypothetical protein VFQ54_06240 [Thermomicrobiales bacterium]|nr:hypothetical protein [Thermomicrobiales bacterium]
MPESRPDLSTLPRYERPKEATPAPVAFGDGEPIAYADLARFLETSTLTVGGRDLLRGLLRLGRAAIFAGGGAGIEYSSLLKTATRPEYIGAHVQEVAAHLRACGVDVLVVPGMSGYPVGSMYSIASGIPAVLLKKQKLAEHAIGIGYPPGAFLIPSYTGDGDVLMSADPASMQDIVDEILEPQFAAQTEGERIVLRIRVAGADDIIDKATMSQAVSDSALIVGKTAIANRVARYRRETGDERPVEEIVEVVAWVTPLIKGYNRPHEHLQRWFGVTPFAGINVTSVHLEPSAIGVEGIGIVAFAPER